MAKQRGIIKLAGTFGDITFYKSQDGYMAREKGGVDGERISSDPSFQRTRENNAEFGNAAAAGKTLRNAVRNLMMNTADNRVSSRLTQIMSQIKNHDTDSVRGERSVAQGILTTPGLELLKGFDFNNKATLGSVLFAPFTVTTTTGIISIPDFVPINDLVYPAGATNVTLKGAFATINFETSVSAIEYSNVVDLPISATAAPVTLTPDAVPTGGNINLYLLSIEFFQVVNGVQYSLKNGSFNALNIVQTFNND